MARPLPPSIPDWQERNPVPPVLMLPLLLALLLGLLVVLVRMLV
jgi:hypothetical protein